MNAPELEELDSSRPSKGTILFKSWLGRLSHVVVLGGIIASFGTVAGFLGRWGWVFDLAAHFRVQYAVALAFAGSWLLFQKRVVWMLAALSFLIPNAVCISSIYSKYPSPAIPRKASQTVQADERASIPTLRVLSANVWTKNSNHQKVIDFVRAEQPDIAAFIEVSAGWANSLLALNDEYPFRLVDPDVGNFGIAIYSRIPFDSTEIRYGPVLKKPSAIVRFEFASRHLALVATHPIPPKTPHLGNVRNQHLAELAEWIRAEPAPVILVGDLNITSWSPWFGDLLQTANLRDSRQGFGTLASWPAFFPPLAIPIDHCLVSPELLVSDRRLGPRIGSDHLPVICHLQVR